MSAPRLELQGLSKSFGTLTANAGIDLAIRPGEIHALLGENGAGKSTLVNMVYGLLAPDAGRILIDGRDACIDSPRAARAAGIGMVFQHFSLFEPLTVAENIALGLDRPGRHGRLVRRIRDISKSFGLPLVPERRVGELSTGERQRIEIVRALLAEPRLLIMDEPTSVLTPQEAESLFHTLRKLAAEGCAILYISHKLEEVRALCEAATVLRHGRVVGTADPRATSARDLAAMMVGSTFVEPVRQGAPEPGPPRLVLDRLSRPREGTHGVALKEIGLEVRAGEIVGIAGIAGNGQAELLAALAGEVQLARADMIRLEGQAVGRRGPSRRRRLGQAYVPEERNGHGAIGALSLTENTILGAWQRAGLARGGWLRRAPARTLTAGIIQGFDVRASGPEAAARSLSGGNLQKFVIGREIGQAPSVLIVAQPTWGVDAAAAASIHRALIELAEAGAAILLLSQDLDEILKLADRIAVIDHGRLSSPIPRAAADRAQLGLMMGGLSHPTEGAPVAA